MKVNNLIESLELEVLTHGDLEKNCEGCYSGDLLSWVMSKAKENDIWLTVMGNVNAIAVAVLTDCACIVLTENSTLDAQAKERAQQQGITVLRSGKNAYELSVLISQLI